MRFLRCPDEIRLEGFLYGDLSVWEEFVIRFHLLWCAECRTMLGKKREFDLALKSISLEEPPAGFEDDLIRMVRGWDFDPDPAPIPPEPAQSLPTSPIPWNYKVRWALGSLVFLLGSFLQYRFGPQLPRIFGGGVNLLFSLQDLGALWEHMVSGAWWNNLVAVVAAIRTDGFASLEILSSALPSQVLSVIVFGGIVVVVFINQRRASKDRGEGIE